MADETTGQERTERATPRRRSKARGEGNVARSVEISSVAVLGIALVTLAGLGPMMVGRVMGLLTYHFQHLGFLEITPDTFPELARHAGATLGAVVLPFAGVIAAVGIGANVLQTGFVLTGKPLEPKLNRISPATGFKRIFSRRGLVELTKSLIKLAIVAGIIVWALMTTIESFMPLMTVGLAAGYRAILGAMFRMAGAGALALALVAILDLFFQRWDYERQLMMTRQEIKEEHKQNEGDPHMKSRIRSLQMEATRRRMMEAVKTADVVVTNPLRFAVALKYESAKMHAPKVVAKGARLLAHRIRKIAREAGVPVVENPPLARALYHACKVGASIPLSLYQAVAELLAFVYRQRETAPGGIR